MKSKRLFQIFVLLTLLLSPLGSARASTGSIDKLDAMVINRSLSYWDATYFGFVSASIFENWQFEFTESHDFTVTATPISGDLLPQLSLLDTGGNTLGSGTGALTSTQPAGSYSIQVQPASGSGFYMLTIRENVVNQPDPSVTTSVNPGSINAGETATVTVSLNNVPASGYTSAEFTCTYNASLVQVSNIAVAGLFGADAAAAINDPQNGSFIVAIAGSNGNRATTSGAAFTFTVTGLQAGQSAIECTVRVSKGDNVLTSLSSTGTSLTVVGSLPTATQTPTPFDTPTPVDTATPTSLTPVDTATPTSLTPVDTATPTSLTPVDTATPTSLTPVDTATPTSLTPADTATPTSLTPVDTATPTSLTPVDSATPTSLTPVDTATPAETTTPVESPTPTALPDGSLTGQVLAGKPVTVSLYGAGNTLVTSVPANPDGTFSLTAPAGTYNVVATASGFLSAQGSATITGGGTDTKPTVTLLAGDIDGNNVIDQFDALTIGMNYNGTSPSAADLNNDGIINVLDLEALAGNYRATGPIAWE